MRRLLFVLVVVTTACGTTGRAPEPTASTAGSAPATSSVPAPDTTRPETTTTLTGTTTTLADLQAVAWEEVGRVDGFVTGFALAGDDLLVAVKDGRVVRSTGDGSFEALLDVAVNDGGERGLLDIAVHPDFPDDPRIWLHHSARNGDTVLREVTFDGETVSGEVVVFEHDQPAGNHNGGSLEFGPDGMLYLGLGDGGGGGDRYGHGQRTDTHLAGILRFDVSAPGEVSVPAGNPFPDAEFLWVYGLRNPWRFAFDGDTVWIADVGQNRWEEINRLDVATAAGANLGWPVLEGDDCYEARDCDAAGMALPVATVEHGDEGTCSITGGVVYRGAAIPELDGQYLFSDYCGGWLRSIAGDEVVRWDVDSLDGPAAFGFDTAGEVLVSGTDGVIRRLVPVR